MHGLDDDLPGRALPPPPDALSNSLDPDAEQALDAPTQAVPLLERPITAGTLVGPYLVQRLLADGGMGRVYLAEDRHGAPVALKLLNLQNARDPATRRRFDREGEILARLNHPNIVRLLGRGVDEPTGRAYLALEFVPGQDLSNLLVRCDGHRLSVDEAVFVIERCARALTAAHAINVLHRDIKPANVLVTRDGQVKLTDFGVALLADDPVRLTATDHVMGTLPYLAPEVLVDGAWTTKGDVYGLGCLAFKLMTGQPPFPQRQVQEVVAAHRRQQAPSLLTFVPDAPPALADLLARMLAKSPAQRPTAAEVEAGLRDLGLSERTARVALEWSKGRVGARAFPSGRYQVAPAAGPPPPARPGQPASTGRASGAFVAAALERIDAYEVVSRLGRGAMGEVYLVRDAGGGPPLALKLLSSDLVTDGPARERFRRELESMSRLEGHPGIVALRGHGALPDGRPYYVMDYVQGQSLKHAMRAGMPAPQVLDALEQVADALAHAHARGFVHRDVKPENILLDQTGRARLADFGLVKALAPGQRSLTLTGELVGTPAYMAPEQANQDLGPVGPHTDVFALGAMLYEALAGAPPYIGATAIEVYTKLIEGAPVSPPSAVRPEVPPALEAVVLRAIARRPADRYPDAAAFLADLRTARAGGRRGDRAVRLLVTLAAGAAALGVAAVATLALRRPPDAEAAAPTAESPARVNEALSRGDVARARALLGPTLAHPSAPWVLALAGEPARALTLMADAPAHARARVAAWAGDAGALERALADVTPPARARALAHELGAAATATPPAEPLEGWGAVAEGEARLAEGDVAFAAVAFEVVAEASDPELRLAASWGHARVALARGDLPAARAALERAATLADHPLDRGRIALWRAALAGDAGAARPVDALPPGLARARELARTDGARALDALPAPGAGSFVDAEAARALAGRGGVVGLVAARGLLLVAAAEAGEDRAGASQALEALAVAEQVDPASPAVAVAQGRAALILHDVARAEAALARARAAAPDDARVALLGARVQATRAAERTLELDLARLAKEPRIDEELAQADAWGEVALAARDAALRAAPGTRLAAQARALAARASLARVDLLRRSGVQEGAAALEDARRQLAADVAAATSTFAAPLADARRRLVGVLLADAPDDAAVDQAEDALGRAIVDAAAAPGLDAAEEVLAIAAQAGPDGGQAVEAYLALAGDAPARALRRVSQARATTKDPSRQSETFARALGLAPDAAPVLLAAAEARVEQGRDVARAAAWLARAAAHDVDVTWSAMHLLARRALDAEFAARLADDAAAAARGPAERALVRALVLASGARSSEPAWREVASAAREAAALEPTCAAAHVLRAVALARVGGALPEHGQVDPRFARELAHALACARAAAPHAAAPHAVALHVVGVSGVSPDDALERLLALGYLRNYRDLHARPEGGPNSAIPDLMRRHLDGNLGALEGPFDLGDHEGPRGPRALLERLEEQGRLPRVALALRLELVKRRRTRTKVVGEVAQLERLLGKLPAEEAVLRAGAEAVFLDEATRRDDGSPRRAELALRAGAAALRARAARPVGGPPPPRRFLWAPRPRGQGGPADAEVGVALEDAARRPALLIVARAAGELARAQPGRLLAPDDLARPWSASRALLDEPRREDTAHAELALRRRLDDDAWGEMLMALGRAAAFPGDHDPFDEQLRDAIEDEVVDELCADDDVPAERRRAGWRLVAAAARDARAAAQDPSERTALTGLLCDALLHEAGCRPAGSDREGLLAHARALNLLMRMGAVKGERRALEAAWRNVRAAPEAAWAAAVDELARRLERASDDDRRRLARLARLDPWWPTLSQRREYRALFEPAGAGEDRP